MERSRWLAQVELGLVVVGATLAGALLMATAAASSPRDRQETICYMTTADGKVVDLTRLCGTTERSQEPPQTLIQPKGDTGVYRRRRARREFELILRLLSLDRQFGGRLSRF